MRERRKTNKYLRQYGKTIKKHRTMTIFASIVAFAFVIFVSSVIVADVARNKAQVAEAQAAQVIAAKEKLEEELLLLEKEKRRDEAFENLNLVARGALVFDVNTDSIIFERNGKEVFPIASITKVMTILTASDYLSPETEIYIDEEAINTEGESGLYLGERWSFKELADLTMIVSSNDGAVAIAKAAGNEINQKNNNYAGNPLEVFVEKMNEKARNLGLKDTIFYNPSGLDLNFETEAGALSSVRDIARLVSFIVIEKPNLLRNSSLSSHTVSSELGRSMKVHNTNYSTDSMPGLLISKTGNTLQAGGTLVIATDVGVMQPVAIVVLGSTMSDREEDVHKLYEATKIYFENL